MYIFNSLESYGILIILQPISVASLNLMIKSKTGMMNWNKGPSLLVASFIFPLHFLSTP